MRSGLLARMRSSKVCARRRCSSTFHCPRRSSAGFSTTSSLSAVAAVRLPRSGVDSSVCRRCNSTSMASRSRVSLSTSITAATRGRSSAMPSRSAQPASAGVGPSVRISPSVTSSRRRASRASRRSSPACSSMASAAMRTSSACCPMRCGSPVRPTQPSTRPSTISGRLTPGRTASSCCASAASISTRPCRDSTSSAPSCSWPMRAGSPLATITPVWSITLTLPSMMVIERSTMDCARVRSSVSIALC